MVAAVSSIVTDNVTTHHATCLVIDLIATIPCIAKVPNTLRELALQLLHKIPSVYIYQTVYDACDTYSGRSIKSSEHKIKGRKETFTIRSRYIRIPPDFMNFLNDGISKEQLLEHIEDVSKGEATLLGSRVVYFARQNTVVRLKSQRAETIEELTNKSQRSRNENLLS